MQYMRSSLRKTQSVSYFFGGHYIEICLVAEGVRFSIS